MTKQIDRKKLPVILGTHRIENECKDINQFFKTVFELGYRIYDTAQGYENEELIGQALRKLSVDRKEYTVIGKLNDDNRLYNDAVDSIRASIEKLGVDFFDIFLIHAPESKRLAEYAMAHGIGEQYWEILNKESWRALINMKSKGYIKEIGVSNFEIKHIKSLIQSTDIVPSFNQIKVYPGYFTKQAELINYCRNVGITVQGYRALGKGCVINNQELISLSKKYQKTPAQIALSFLLQEGIIPIMKSGSIVHLKENANITNFTLSIQDCKLLRELVID